MRSTPSPPTGPGPTPANGWRPPRLGATGWPIWLRFCSRANRTPGASTISSSCWSCRAGRWSHVKELLVPAAWENVVDLSPERRAFSEYHAFLTEPWDGPAGVAVTDGISLASFVDRNGLRPARWAITPNVVLVASEAGVCPEEEARAERTGQLGPGEILLFDRTTGTIQFSEEIKESLAAQAPYEEWIGTETFYVQQPFDAMADDRFDAGPFCRVFGYTPEERRV